MRNRLSKPVKKQTSSAATRFEGFGVRRYSDKTWSSRMRMELTVKTGSASMKVPSFQAVLFFEALPSTQKVTRRFPGAPSDGPV